MSFKPSTIRLCLSVSPSLTPPTHSFRNRRPGPDLWVPPQLRSPLGSRQRKRQGPLRRGQQVNPGGSRTPRPRARGPFWRHRRHPCEGQAGEWTWSGPPGWPRLVIWVLTSRFRQRRISSRPPTRRSGPCERPASHHLPARPTSALAGSTRHCGASRL
jgi:hypothetical protein